MNTKSDLEKFHNLVEWLHQQKEDSPYSNESWDELIEENENLRIENKNLKLELANCCKQHEQCASELYDLKQKYENPGR